MKNDTQPPQSLKELFWVFFVLAMQCFGGAMAVVQRGIIDERKWYDKDEYVEMFALIQAIPGPNVCKVIIFTGAKFFGFKGAVVALLGFTLMPFVATLLMCFAIQDYLDLPMVSGALKAVLAAASGMGIGGCLSLAETYKTHPIGPRLWFLGAFLTFFLFAVVRLPLVYVLLLCGIPWVLITYFIMKKKGVLKWRK